MIDKVTAALADQYRVLRELGSGGMATVYLAEDIKHRRRVAVKVLRPDLAASLGRDLDLADEALVPQGGRQLGTQHLECDPSIVLQVIREIDGGHAAGTGLAVKTVAVRQGGLEPAEQFGHCPGLWGSREDAEAGGI